MLNAVFNLNIRIILYFRTIKKQCALYYKRLRRKIIPKLGLNRIVYYNKYDIKHSQDRDQDIRKKEIIIFIVAS